MSGMLEAPTHSIAGSPPVKLGDRKVPARSWWLLAFLVAAHTCCWTDRYLVIILGEPMKRDLGLTDSQLGLISGFAFSLVYALAALPAGRLVDRASRPLFLSIVITTFSAATMLGGLAKGIMTLGLSRLIVAAAESGLSPAAYSLISDSFPVRLRGRGISIYSLGLAIGPWAGLTFGGLLNDTVGWRNSLLIVGAPGLLLGIAALVWIRDPLRGGFDSSVTPPQVYTSSEALRFMLSSRTFVAIALAVGLLTITTGAFEGWVPTYLIRHREMGAGTAGTLSGTFSGIGGCAATLLVGALVDVLGRRDVRWYLWLPLIGSAIFIPSQILFFHTLGLTSYILYFIAIVGDAFYIAPLFALGQMLLPPRVRALGAAMMLLVTNLVGMGGGMYGAGLISDRLIQQGSTDSLGGALQILQVGAVLGIVSLVLACSWVKRDLAALS